MEIQKGERELHLVVGCVTFSCSPTHGFAGSLSRRVRGIAFGCGLCYLLMRIHTRLCREPLKFLLGGGNILAGMEKAMLGTCEGDEISVNIPPELAFDDPTKNFASKPVPDGTWVTYNMKVVGIEKGHGSASLPRRQASPPQAKPARGVVEIVSDNSGAVMFAIFAMFVWVMLRAPSGAPGKKERKKKKKG